MIFRHSRRPHALMCFIITGWRKDATSCTWPWPSSSVSVGHCHGDGPTPQGAVATWKRGWPVAANTNAFFFLCAPAVHLISWGSAVLHPRLKFSGHWALTVRWCVVRTSKGTCHFCAWGTRPSDWTQWLQRAVEKVHLRTRRRPQI